MKNVVTLVLGGGRGTRLYPLTKYRSKPSVPLAGKYRLIDIPLSNCINSGLNRAYVVTQFNSVSLHRHISSTYRFDQFSGGFVELLAAQQTNENANWYQGTADAVRQNLGYVNLPDVDYVLILSGDQLYRMDYLRMIRQHAESNADVTICAVPVDSRQAASFGIMRLGEEGRVAGFLEKPKTEDELSIVRTDPAWIDSQGIPSRGRDCLASTGIYLFNRRVMLDLLEKTTYQDFGKEIFPAAIRTCKVQVHLFDGYWEDIGTIRAFFDANLGMALPEPTFDPISVEGPIYSRARFLAPTRLQGATVSNCLIADGCRIEEGAVIENSVIGLRCRIGRNAVIRNSVVMGNDYYQNPGGDRPGRPPLGIGAGAHIEGAIIDKNCFIGRNVRVINTRGVENTDETDFGMIVDGIVVIPKGTTLPDDWQQP